LIGGLVKYSINSVSVKIAHNTIAIYCNQYYGRHISEDSQLYGAKYTPMYTNVRKIQRMMKLKLAMRKKFFNQLKNLRNGKLKYLSTGARVI